MPRKRPTCTIEMEQKIRDLEAALIESGGAKDRNDAAVICSEYRLRHSRDPITVYALNKMLSNLWDFHRVGDRYFGFTIQHVKNGPNLTGELRYYPIYWDKDKASITPGDPRFVAGHYGAQTMEAHYMTRLYSQMTDLQIQEHVVTDPLIAKKKRVEWTGLAHEIEQLEFMQMMSARTAAAAAAAGGGYSSTSTAGSHPRSAKRSAKRPAAQVVRLITDQRVRPPRVLPDLEEWHDDTKH